MEQSPNYATISEKRDIVAFLKLLHSICNGSDNGGLSFKPFKAIVAVKILNNVTTYDPTNVHYYKHELCTKYDATKSIFGKLPFGTVIMAFLKIHTDNTPNMDFTNYCRMNNTNKGKVEKDLR